MHFSLNTSFLVLVLAQILAIGPVNARENDPLKQHLIKRASDRFHKSALRHSADLAHDLRTAFGGLGGSYAARASLARRSSDGSKPFCVSNRASVNQTGTVANFNNASSTPSATGTKPAIPSSTSSLATSPTPSTAQSDFHLVQSYVRIDKFCVGHACRRHVPDHLIFIVRKHVFRGMGFLHRSRSNPWACAVCRRADSGACDRAFSSSGSASHRFVSLILCSNRAT